MCTSAVFFFVAMSDCIVLFAFFFYYLFKNYFINATQMKCSRNSACWLACSFTDTYVRFSQFNIFKTQKLDLYNIDNQAKKKRKRYAIRYMCNTNNHTYLCLFEVGCLFECDVYVIHPVVGFVKLFLIFFLQLLFNSGSFWSKRVYLGVALNILIAISGANPTAVSARIELQHTPVSPEGSVNVCRCERFARCFLCVH